MGIFDFIAQKYTTRKSDSEMKLLFRGKCHGKGRKLLFRGKCHGKISQPNDEDVL